ncbi:MAG: DAK2 domain-containing protein [Dehalococcoidia bacterium]|nr:DAK2 domain-containing protein [Dehalococcoidia bacterium]
MIAATSLTAQQLREALEAAERWLALNRDAVNAINVYPVPDGDTGTNMLLTWRAALKAGEDVEGGAGAYLAAVARGALLGARGNSGVILSQMLRGLAETLTSAEDIDCASLCRALEGASTTAYSAVSQPVEGTMLTVMREAAAACAAAERVRSEFAHVLEAFVDEARASVERTPDLLPRLRDAGVVDAGGLGIAVLFEGVHLGITRDPLPDPRTPGTAQVALDAVEHEGHGYCTEFVVLGVDIDRVTLQDALDAAGGESILVVGDADAVHVHVHLTDPGPALTAGVRHGALAAVKVENMQAQHEEWTQGHEARHEEPGRGGPAEQREAPAFGLVAVARGAGIVATFRELGAARVLDGGPTGKASAGELLEAATGAGRERVFLLPNDKDVLMAAEQAAAQSGGLIEVIPARSVAAGLAAAVAYLPEGDADNVAEQMREAMGDVRSIEATVSVRDAVVDGVDVRSGDGIALLDGVLVCCEPTVEDAALAAIRRAVTPASALITLYAGAGAPGGGDVLRRIIEDAHPDLEVEVIEGGQPHYPYVLAVE